MGSDQLVDEGVSRGAGDGPRGWVLADDSSAVTSRPSTGVSVRLDTDELPFQQPDRRAVAVESAGGDWRRSLVEAGKWPLLALGATAVLIAIFALFISRNGQSLGGNGDAPETDSAAEVDSAAATAGAADTDGESEVSSASESGSVDVDAQALAVSSQSAGGGQTPGGQTPGRSTGTLGSSSGSGFVPGQIIEPDDALTGPDGDWVSTTTTRPPSTTASTASSSTTVASSTTPSTEPTTTTAAEPEGPWARPVGPGGSDPQNPQAVSSSRVTLQAEGSDEQLRYRFTVYVWDDDRWRQVGRSRWRSDSWTVDVRRYDDRTVRWTVTGRTRSRQVTEESPPLHFYVGGGQDGGGDNGGGDDDDDDGEDAAPVERPAIAVANGDFEQGVGGVDTVRFYGNDSIAGWASSNGTFEIWASGFEGVTAASGSHFLELNGTAPTTITQQLDVTPGATLVWSFQHRSRTGEGETVAVQFGPAGAPAVQFTASGDRWQRRSGEYRVPPGVNRIQFAISAVTRGSVGNLIDDIRVQTVS